MAQVLRWYSKPWGFRFLCAFKYLTKRLVSRLCSRGPVSSKWRHLFPLTHSSSTLSLIEPVGIFPTLRCDRFPSFQIHWLSVSVSSSWLHRGIGESVSVFPEKLHDWSWDLLLIFRKCSVILLGHLQGSSIFPFGTYQVSTMLSLDYAVPFVAIVFDVR